MSNNDKKPDGWAMPDDLAKKISELVNKKQYGLEDDIHKGHTYGYIGEQIPCLHSTTSSPSITPLMELQRDLTTQIILLEAS